jgi:hypothetical protein
MTSTEDVEISNGELSRNSEYVGKLRCAVVVNSGFVWYFAFDSTAAQSPTPWSESGLPSASALQGPEGRPTKPCPGDVDLVPKGTWESNRLIAVRTELHRSTSRMQRETENGAKLGHRQSTGGTAHLHTHTASYRQATCAMRDPHDPRAALKRGQCGLRKCL